MILAAAAYIAGLFFASFFTITAVLICATAAAAILLIGRYCGMNRADFVIAAVVFAVGAGYMSAYTALKYDPVIAYEGKTAGFSGEVTGIRIYSGGKAQYTLSGKIDDARSADITLYTDDLGAEYGDIISIENCTFALPEGDYLYDRTDKLRSEGVFLTAEKADGISLSEKNTHKLKRRLTSYREKMCRRFDEEMGAENGELLAGMVFGQTSGIDSDTRTSLSRCGIAHMLAVSGLHVSIAAFLLMELLKKLRIRRYIAYGILNVFLILLIIMADSPISAVRASIMLDMMYAAGLFRRQNDTFNSLSTAVLLICLANPYTIYSSGFCLSVTGTFGIGVAAPYFIEAIPGDSVKWWLPSGFIAMLCTSLCIMPLSMLYFDETSLVSPIMNMFVVPLCTTVLIFGLVYVFTGGMISLLAPARYVIEAVLHITDTASRIRYTHFSASDRTIWLAFVLAAVIALIQLIVKRRKITAYAAAAACCIMLMTSTYYSYKRYNELTVAVLGRGSNAAVVVTYRGRTDVVDLSGHHKTAAYVRKYLMQNGIDSVDMLVLTSRIPSQYSAYAGEFSHIEIRGIAASEDTAVYGAENAVTYGSEGFFCDLGSYTLTLEDDILTVSNGSEDLYFIPGKTGKVPEGRCFYYGSIPSGTEIASDSVVLNEETNNIEIVLSEDGTNSTRRLKCHTLI